MGPKRQATTSGNEPKRARTQITLEEKLKIIRKYEGGMTLSAISKEIGKALSTVNTIVKDKERIKEATKGSVELGLTIISKKRQGPIAEMEKHLVRWMHDNIRKNTPMSLMLIQEKARSLYNDIKNKAGIEEGCFNASSGWFCRFKKRSQLEHVSVSGEAASADTDAAAEFPQILEEIVEEGGYLPEQIFNVDETGLFWKRMPKKTYIFKEEKSMPGFKVAKDRLTIMLGANASGDCKLKPLAVYHSQRPRAFKGLALSLLPVIWMANKKGWVTKVIFEDWFINHFIPEVKKYCEEKGIPFNILLILDNAPGHPPALDDLNPDVKVLYLPPRTTPLLQPMDQGAIRAFKALYHRYSYAQMFNAIDKGDGTTVKEFWKGYNILDCVKHVKRAWDEVTPKCLNGVWRQLTPQFVNDFTGFTGVEEARNKVLELANAMQLDLEEDDFEELMESHEGELTNEDLIEIDEYLQEEASQEEEEPEVVKRFTAKGLREAFNHMEQCLTTLESMDPNVQRIEEFRAKVESAMTCYRLIYDEKARSVHQTTIESFFKRTSSADRGESAGPSSTSPPPPSSSSNTESAQ